jgi:type II secretory pathway pseudopilin PulG
MQRLGDGQLEEAWKDLRACHRLARLTAQDPTLVSQLVAVAVDGITCSGTQQLLNDSEMSESLAKQILAELSAMGSVSDIARSLDQGERLYYLDTMLRVAKGGVSINELVKSYSARGLDGGLEDLLSHTRIDWNQLLESGNRWYDRFTAAMRLDTRTDRLKEYDRIDRKLHELDGAVKRPLALLGSLFSRYQRGEMVGDFMLAFSLPSLQASSNAQDRSATASELTRLAAALAVYRAQHGAYPPDLVALVPDVLPELPHDLYSEKPFLYQRKPDGGYLLYSVIENGVDDGSTNYWGNIVNGEWVDKPQDVDWNKFDLVVRVPVPPFRLPDPPVAE